jgi:molybdopterin molybdotransferase
MKEFNAMTTSPPDTVSDDCCASPDGLMRHDEAVKALCARARAIGAVEEVALEAASGRVLAGAVHAPRPVPAFDNAAMDGYAMAHASLAADGPSELPVSAVVAAGHPLDGVVAPGEAVRIFTGAVMPAGADTVIMQEDTQAFRRDGRDSVRIPPGARKGANLRRAGEDVAAGAELIGAGTRLRPQDVAAIASTGLGQVRCAALVKVALVSSGDEIIRPGVPFHEGAVYDSNTFLLRSLLGSLPVAVDDLGILPDTLEDVRGGLEQAAGNADLILTSGGSSLGDEDYMTRVVSELGELHMWRLAIKPGKPLAFGRIGDCLFLGLPGNPVAAAITFMLYARPLLLTLAGTTPVEPRRFILPAAFAIPKRKTGRREFQRGTLVERQGNLHVARFDRDGSGLISSLRAADGLIDLPEELDSVAEGDKVAFIPFGELGIG